MGFVSALQICCNAWIDCRCCAFNPGFGLPALMFLMRHSFPVRVERAKAVLTNAPPPSPYDPSRVIIRPVLTSLFLSGDIFYFLQWEELVKGSSLLLQSHV